MAMSNVNADVLSELSKSVAAELITAGMISQPRQKRKRVDWERLLVYEYVQTYYLDVPHWFREEVGPLPQGENPMLYAKTRRWADAIVHLPDKTLLIEGKMKAEPSVIGQLLNYRNLLPQTPLFYKYREIPIEMQLVCAKIDTDTEALVKQAGIDVVMFKPSNYDTWVDVITKRKGARDS